MLTALQEIQREMGPDAIVLSMREIPTGPAWQVWNKPGVEVVASTQVPQQPVEKKPVTAREEQVPGRKEIEAILAAIAEKRNFTPTQPGNTLEVLGEENTRPHIGTSREPARWSPPVLQPDQKPNLNIDSSSSITNRLGTLVDEIMQDHQTAAVEISQSGKLSEPLEHIRRRLIRQGIDREYVDRLLATNKDAMSPVILEDETRLSIYIRKQMEASLKPQKNAMAVLPSRIMCLIGATGSGKTSTCAKLAAFYSRTLGKKVVWICADTIRAGAIAETRTYTDVLNIPLFFAYTPQELGELVAEQDAADLILVDTPGVNMMDEDKVLELGTFLSQVPGRSIYLTTPATTKLADLRQSVSTFSPFSIRGFVVTKMDETFAFGEIFQLVLETHLPVMYFTNGTQVLGKLQPGEPSSLVSAIFGEGLRS
jgi:flagellar biosynthesis protein FlhF